MHYNADLIYVQRSFVHCWNARCIRDNDAGCAALSKQDKHAYELNAFKAVLFIFEREILPSYFSKSSNYMYI